MMTQADDHRRTSDTLNGQRVQNPFRFNGSKAETSPTFEQLLQRDGSKWSRISLHKQKKNNDQEDKQNHHKKMSVLAKVKEKAKKLKLSLSGKKGHDEKDSTTRSSVVGPKDKGKEDAEYHSARMYDSKHPPALILKNHSEKSKDELASSSNTIAETQSKNHVPLETAKNDTKTKVTTSDVPQVQESSDSNSRFLGLMVSTQESVASKSEEGEKKTRESQMRDRGVSVKEYLMHKFEPGEDERALSKVITQTISPRRDKVREAMSSFLKNEEPSNQVNSSNADNNVNVNFKSKSLPASTNFSANTAGSEIASIEQSHSLGSIATKASSNLNQTFKSTFASYKVHFLGSNSKNNMKLISSSTSFSPNTNTRLNDSLARFLSPTKTSSTSLGLALSANESQAPVSNADQTRVPSHTVTSVRRVPVSSSVRTWVPNQTRVSGQTNAHEDRFSVSTSDTGMSAV